MKFAKRLDKISASPTMAVMQEAQKLRSQGLDIIDLGPGEPDFATPQSIKEEGIKAIQEDFTKYTASAGIQELRQAVADQYNLQWGSKFSVENVVISCGAKHSIFNVCMAIFEEGDEVLLPAPYWVTFPEVIKMTGASPREFMISEENDFILGCRDVEERFESNTKGLIVTTPNNPTGAVIPGPMLEKLVSLSRSHRVFTLFDECYDFFVYGEKPYVSAASFLDPSDDFFAIFGSVSKKYSMTGWRIGYCIAHPELVKKIVEFQSHQTSNPTSISQKAALFALGTDRELIIEMKQEYEKRRDFVLPVLQDIDGFSCVKPDGAFYMFPNVSECMQKLSIDSSEEFAKFLIQEARVATVPGSAFGAEGYIRISYATSMENLQEAMSRIQQAVEARI
ncbi:MAG: pyridoxal phosphate-dependent aminotransferase [Acidobacteriota bacterium]|nr:pyridoxal phosphate-dependent aminotransferase [Acidobacteriota bacterium]